MSSHRIPGAINNGFEEEFEHEFADPTPALEEKLAAVRRTASELLAQSPHRPSTLNVRAGDVAVEMTWDAGTAPAPAADAQSAAAAASGQLETAPATLENVVTATTVGVFYRASSPGAAPFVSEGDQVVPGQQLAIIEAMKLMLPVEADCAGRVVEVLVKDGESVEYGQPLFAIAPAEHG